MRVLSDAGMMPGIKVDTGAKELAGAPGESVTEGLDGLRERLAEYTELGRSVHQVAGGHCHRAGHAQRVLPGRERPRAGPLCRADSGGGDGSRWWNRKCSWTETTTSTSATTPRKQLWQRCFGNYEAQGVALDGILLKPNMVLSGASAAGRAGREEVAEMTVRCLKSTVPATVPGIVFLSGGQGDEEATTNLDAINRCAQRVGAPWELSFSYGRGLQGVPLRTWAGNNENRAEVERVFHHRAKVTAAARQGRYDVGMEAGR